MTFPRRGTRKIGVDGVLYRWIVSPDDEPGLGLIVEAVEFPGKKMTAWVDHGNIISSWLVKKVILHALSKGWSPQNLGQSMGFRFEGIHSKACDQAEPIQNEPI